VTAIDHGFSTAMAWGVGILLVTAIPAIILVDATAPSCPSSGRNRRLALYQRPMRLLSGKKQPHPFGIIENGRGSGRFTPRPTRRRPPPPARAKPPPAANQP
jgi:hypothetical protein